MNYLSKILDNKKFSFAKKKHKSFFKQNINQLNRYHFKNSILYKKILNFQNFNFKKDYDLSEMPFLPVRLFKEFDMLSIHKKKIYKTLNSSGTSGQKKSKIYLDKENSLNQVKALQKIVSNIVGKDRLPMLIIDRNTKYNERYEFNARVAAINGFSIFGKDHTFVLDRNFNLDYKVLNSFLKKYKNKKFLIFGFTSFIFQYLINKLDKKKINSDLSNAILIHGGGWKKLEKLKISNKKFKTKLKNNFNLKNIHNYYGLVEQTGSIFLECKCGYLVASEFSDVIIRDENFNILKKNETGFIQLFSLLPTSYPGHNILTEDIGKIIDDNDCNCSFNGKKFLVEGRVKEAEIRGCSDI